LLRPILIVPGMATALAMSAVVVLAVPVAWVTAWRSGRNRIHPYLALYVSFVARVGGYHTLLTDQLPGLNAHDHQNIEVRNAQSELSRRELLLWIVLAPIALIIVSVLQLGRTVILVLFWPWSVLSGSLPSAVFDAVCCSERFYLRTLSYSLLIQRDYPRDLFGERVLRKNHFSLLEALAHGPRSAEEPLGQRARDIVDPQIVWPLRTSSAARRIVAACLVLGVLVCAVARNEYQLANQPPQLSLKWSNAHYLSLRSLIDAVELTDQDLSTIPVSWSTVSSDCNALAAPLVRESRVAPYPDSRENHDLLSGLRDARHAWAKCEGVVSVSTRREGDLTRLRTQFNNAETVLVSFLDEIAQPGQLS
jgi:hypothetical protein